MRRIASALLAGVFVIVGSAACVRPRPAALGAPSCAGTPVEQTIRAAFAGTGHEEWALRVTWRESRCVPTARNRSGAVGLFQLVNHGDLLWAACPYDFDAGIKADCNARAARILFDGRGRAPWGG